MRKLYIYFIFIFSLCLPCVTFADNGVLNWVKTGGGSGYDEGYSIGLDGAGNIYVTGPFTGTVDVDFGDGVYNLTAVGDVDTFVAKFDPSGNFVWGKKIGGTSDDRSFSIAVDANGNSYTTGRFSSIGADFDPGDATYPLSTSGSYDIYILKLDTDGNFVWAKKMGGTNWEWPYNISIDSSSNVYTTGGFYGTGDFDPGAGIYNLVSTGAGSAINDDVFISKLDKDGNFVWAKQLGGASCEWGAFVFVSSTGDVYTTGGFRGTVDFDPGTGTYNLTSSGVSDIFISKLDSSGNFVWAKKVGGTGDDYGNGLDMDANNNIYITGNFSGTADFDPGAGTNNMVSSGDYDNFILKLDSSGNYVWSKKTGGSSGDWGYIIRTRLEEGNTYVYIGGTFSGTGDFNPGSDVYNLVSNGAYDNFIMKLDSSGALIWAHGFGGNYDDWLNYFVLGQGTDIYMAGSFAGTADLDPGDLVRNIDSVGDSDIFFMKLDHDITSPNIIEFDLPESFASLTVPITSFDVEDNVGVTGYFISTNNTEPTLDDPNWLSVTPSEYIFSEVGQKTLYVWAKDEKNNLSAMSSDQVLIDMDNPSIVLNGKSLIKIYRNKEYIDKGAIATDYTDGDLTSNIVVVNNVDTSTLGTYIITYNVSDSAGNNAVEVTRTVKVIKRPTVGSIPFAGYNPFFHIISNQEDESVSSNSNEEKSVSKETVSEANDESESSNVVEKINTAESGNTSVISFILRTLKKGLSGDDVKQLQIYFNTHGYKLAEEGVGSSGHETNYFGNLTKAATIKFQKDKGLDPDGIIGPLTRAKLNNN